MAKRQGSGPLGGRSAPFQFALVMILCSFEFLGLSLPHLKT